MSVVIWLDDDDDDDDDDSEEEMRGRGQREEKIP